MTEMPDRDAASPFVTLWLKPRQTITRVVATRHQHLVPVLAALGMIASLYAWIVRLPGIAPPELEFWFALVAGGAVLGIAWLYLNGAILGWIGHLLGGHATATELRAALAWSAVPSITGFIVMLATGGLTRGDNARGIAALVVLIFGLWSLVVFLLMLGRLQHFGFWRTIILYVLDVAFPLILAVAFRTFLFQPFNIPSKGMMPTLVAGDYLFVSKYAYGYTHYSLPFSPQLFSGRIFASQPRRGDVVVYRLPKDDTADFVQRIVGLPGERLQMKAGQLYINGTPVQREPLAGFTGDDPCGGSGASPSPVKRWRETLDSGASYETLDCIDNGFYDNTSLYTVPQGHYFMMGDNRDNSSDSRVLSAVGYVPFENLVGRAGMIFFSRKEDSREARRERIGTIVR
jgi:signal peptidase I